eukprot:TRINITY_DN1660_c0_g1_i1.p1 TRINITY_DN1660_c0_g1~~TRINITY_DN1660_c0_g1_i1.p1  ORF type:complete len:531 (-),score=94.76 TRINITY_DN1660_c0_g1_i1:43-1476(-)
MDVAIKNLENFNQDKLRDFLDEVQIMSKVLNPHVVLLLGACTTGPISEWCMVTELCSRGDLEHLLYDPDTKLSLSKKFSFAIDICLGLSWLNGKEIQVTHHDLKPANVFVSQDWRCKVGDFGLAWLNIKDQEGFGTESGGSPLYESPESLQVRLRTATAEVYSEQSDVWSYSMVVWEIFKQKLIYSDDDGNLPFSSAQQYYDFLESGGLPPTDGIPEPMVNIFKKCWQFRASDRPSFQDLLPLLRLARIDSYLPKDVFPDANTLWCERFLEEANVTIPTLVEALQSRKPHEHERLLKILFWGSEDKGDKRSISLSKFKKLLYWFGWSGLSELLPTLRRLSKEKYFYGIIDSKALGQQLTSPGMFMVRLNEGKTRGVETCPFYIARLDQKGKPQILPVSPSKKNAGFFFCSIPSSDVDKKFRSKEKAETQLSGSEPGIPSLIHVIQSRTKKFLSKSIAHSPFNPAPATNYNAAAEEER